MSGRSGETPLERAFHWARTFDLIKLAPVAEYLIGIGVPVTDKIRTYMRSAGRSSMENCGIFLCLVRDMRAQFRARSSVYRETCL